MQNTTKHNQAKVFCICKIKCKYRSIAEAGGGEKSAMLDENAFENNIKRIRHI